MSSDCTLKVAEAPTATDVLTGSLVMCTTGFWLGAEDGAGVGAWGLSLEEPPALQPANKACTIAHAAAFWYVVVFKVVLPLALSASVTRSGLCGASGAIIDVATLASSGLQDAESL